MFKELKD